MSMSSRLGGVPLVDLVPIVALFAYAVPAFLVFLVRTAVAGVPRTARIESVPRSPYLPRLIMEYAYWVFAQPVWICRRVGIGPDALSYASLVVSVAGAVALGAGWFGLGGWTLLLAFALDAWDGMLARALGTASARGEFLDAVIDRYNDLIVFLGLMFYYRQDPLACGLAAAALIGSTLTSYTRAKGEASGVDPSLGFMQRHERAVYLGLFTLISPLVAAWAEPGVAHPRYHVTVAMLALLAVATNVTAIVRARFVLKGLRK
jgi:CDP-diacylglycerol--glycerol-3-phosphate 3-phosphatidyltransferase